MITQISDVLHIPYSVMQSFAIYSILSIILGVVIVNFWKYICFGLFAVFCFGVFESPSVISIKNEQKGMKYESGIQVKDTYKNEFMDDCMTIAMNSKEECEEIYKNNN